jgi:hypothetical protein
MANILFIEEQKLRHNVLWSVLLYLPVITMIFLLVYQLVTEKPLGDQPMTNLSLFILLLCYGAPVVFISYYVRLTTIISDEKILYGWNIPTKELNEINYSEIKTCTVIEYKFVGWGYRLTRLYGTVYNVDGNKGLQVTTKLGAKVLIGTHHAEELQRIIEGLKPLRH